mgnify:CR=1 FL=1
MYDIVIVGSGPAGLTAAVYGLRAGKSVLVIEKNGFGGQIASWSSVDSCGRYKALHYAARKFYAPVAMGLFLEKGTWPAALRDTKRSA